MIYFIFLFLFATINSFSQTTESVSNSEKGFIYPYIFSKTGEGIYAAEILSIYDIEKDTIIYVAISTPYGLMIYKDKEEINKTEFLKIFLRWEKYLQAKKDVNLDIIKMRASNIMRELKR